MSCAQAGFWPSPVATYSMPSGPNRSRPPLWYLLRGMPATSTCGVPDSAPPEYRTRTTRLSVAVVCMTYTHGDVAKSGATASPSRPPSPAVPDTPDSVPTTAVPPVVGSSRTTWWASRRP